MKQDICFSLMTSNDRMGSGTHPASCSTAAASVLASAQALPLFAFELKNAVHQSGTSELRPGVTAVGCALVAFPYSQPHPSPGEDSGLLTLTYTLVPVFALLGSLGKVTDGLWASGR